MIQKTWSIICDGCKSAINHWTGFTKKRLIEVEREDGTIFWKGKHFCCNECLNRFKEAQR